jgi:signal transduction histidine kinase
VTSGLESPPRAHQPRPPLTKRMRRGHWIAIDFVVAAFLTLCALAAGFHAPLRDGINTHGVPAAVVFAGVILLTVGLRRLGPLPAFGVLAAVVALSWVSATVGVASVAVSAMAYVLYQVTVTSTRRTGITALGLGIAEILGIALAVQHHVMAVGPGIGFPGTFGMVVGWLAGYSVRQRRAYVEALQVQAASSAVAQERLRIARELHDVVAHSMSVIAVQAGFGQYVMDTSPADTREALGAIQATSREALAELRRMLAVLRQQDGTATAAPLAPQCGLAELDRLVSRTCLAGVRVSPSRLGVPRELPAGIDMSAFRIIQESLTNVVRHAGDSARCAVVLAYEQDALTIEVTDDGGHGPRPAPGYGQPAIPCPAAGELQVVTPPYPASEGLRGGVPPYPYFTGSGHGLIGMRERAQLCGGVLNAGPVATGGFRVWARLPAPALAAAAARPQAQATVPEPELELI